MTTETEAIAKMAHVEPITRDLDDDRRQFLLPPGWQEFTADDIWTKDRPRRKHGEFSTYGIHGFTDYVNLHRDHDNYTVRVWSDDYWLSAQLNGHEAENPGWGDHLIELRTRFTDAYRRLVNSANQYHSQEDFAHTLGSLTEFVQTPEPADLISLVENLQATVGSTVANSQRLDDGARNIIYTETVTMTLQIPSTIVIETPVFSASDNPTEFTFSLRTRVRDQRISFSLYLPDFHDVVRAAFQNDIVSPVFELLDGNPILMEQ